MTVNMDRALESHYTFYISIFLFLNFFKSLYVRHTEVIFVIVNLLLTKVLMTKCFYTTNL